MIPSVRKGSKKIIRHHVETLYDKAKKDMWNTQNIHWSCNIQIANASLYLKKLAQDCGHHTNNHLHKFASCCRMVQSLHADVGNSELLSAFLKEGLLEMFEHQRDHKLILQFIKRGLML